jgi:predicted nuclease of predicted toxin-antitoxin system
MRIRLYLDEDVPLSFSLALLNRGVDAITTQQAGNHGLSDKEQLVFASMEGRTLFTHNKRDFKVLHDEFMGRGEGHSGIILSDQLPVGVLLKRFMRLWFTLKAEDMHNRLEFLASWK